MESPEGRGPFLPTYVRQQGISGFRAPLLRRGVWSARFASVSIIRSIPVSARTTAGITTFLSGRGPRARARDLPSFSRASSETVNAGVDTDAPELARLVFTWAEDEGVPGANTRR